MATPELRCEGVVLFIKQSQGEDSNVRKRPAMDCGKLLRHAQRPYKAPEGWATCTDPQRPAIEHNGTQRLVFKPLDLTWPFPLAYPAYLSYRGTPTIKHKADGYYINYLFNLSLQVPASYLTYEFYPVYHHSPLQRGISFCLGSSSTVRSVIVHSQRVFG